MYVYCIPSHVEMEMSLLERASFDGPTVHLPATRNWRFDGCILTHNVETAMRLSGAFPVIRIDLEDMLGVSFTAGRAEVIQFASGSAPPGVVDGEPVALEPNMMQFLELK